MCLPRPLGWEGLKVNIPYLKPETSDFSAPENEWLETFIDFPFEGPKNGICRSENVEHVSFDIGWALTNGPLQGSLHDTWRANPWKKTYILLLVWSPKCIPFHDPLQKIPTPNVFSQETGSLSLFNIFTLAMVSLSKILRHQPTLERIENGFLGV